MPVDILSPSVCGWQTASLASVCDLVTDGSHFSPRPQDEGSPIANVKDMRTGYVDIASCTKIRADDFDALVRNGCDVRKNDVLLSKDGTIGRVVVYRQHDRLVALSSIAILRPSQSIDSAFLGHALQSALSQQQFANLASGSALRRLVLRDINRVVVPNPPPGDQVTIGRLLDTVDHAISVAEAVNAKLQQVRAGLLHDLLTRGIDENGELRDPRAHPEDFKESPLGLIPADWEYGPAEGLCERITVGVVNAATQAYVTEGVPFIRSQNVLPNVIDTSEMLFVTEAFNREHAKSILRSGNVAIVRTGYPGTAAVVPPHLDGANCFSLVIATPARGVLSGDFLARYMNSPLCRRLIERLHFGSAQHNFNVGQMRRLPVRLPPIDEQERITAVLARHDELIETQIEERRKLSKLKIGLMSDLLSGRVRVPEDLKIEAAA